MNRIRQFISAVTFAGVIFHEVGHKFFCDITGLNVKRICWFRFGNPAGYVIHDRPRNFYQSFFVAVGPFISGTFFALLFFYMANHQSTEVWQRVLFIWLGVSAAVNAFPSDTDAKNLWRDSNRHISTNLLAAAGYPFSILIWLANGLHIFFFDLFYTLLLYHFVDPIFVLGQ